MASATYRATGSLRVEATSSVHDTTTTWDKIGGDIDVDPDQIEQAKATFAVDMTSYDAGDALKNRKLRKDFALDQHPTATFKLVRVYSVVRDGSKFTAKVDGTLAWRGKEVKLLISGQGTVEPTQLDAKGTFSLDIRDLGLSAPRFFLFKMSDQVVVHVTLRGSVVA